ncbi:MAG: FAD-dependent oxidoreductase, partial [Chloroflexota bacterium]
MSAAPVDPRFARLFSPLRVGSITLRNRIVSSGHDTVMAHEGSVTDQLIAYHETRAAGGVGLIVIQATAVHRSADYTAHALAIYDDAMVPGFRRLADAVHAHGVPIIGQLFHGGREVMDTRDGTLAVALAPSVVPNERFHAMPRAMTTELIAEIVGAYGTAAARFATAGFEGGEIVASHGYLPAQFLNPRVNLRADAYGGSPERRLRFLREVIGAIRAATGRAFVLGLRISVDEVTPEGLTADDVLPALAALDADGLLDYVSVVAGTSATLAGSGHIVPPMTQPNAYTAPLAARARAVVRIPVMVAGRINQPHEAEAILAAGEADACAMTRALISDPELPRKAAAGRLDEIRACVGCNQACIGHFHAGYPISCIQFPETGREQQYGRLAPAAPVRSVMVVGGGPGGLKAAAVAAARGHRVTLYEAGRRVGGQVLLAEMLPGRAEFGGVITNLAGEAERAGVRIVTGTVVDADLVRREAPDVLVVATGARPRRPPLELTSGANVLDAWEVLRGASVPDGRVVVADWRCDWVGLGLAELLARAGHPVTLASTGYTAG